MLQREHETSAPLVSLPVSFNQERRLLFEEYWRRRNADLPPFNIVCGLTVDRRLDLKRLRRALGAVVDRYPALRASFVLREDLLPNELDEAIVKPLGVVSKCGIYEQRIASMAALNLRVVDVAPTEFARTLMSTVWECYERRFDVASPPLGEAAVIRKGASDTVILLVLSGLVCDEWSAELLAAELGRLCAQTADPTHTRAQAAQYHAGLASMNVQTDNESVKEAVEYWRREWQEYGPYQLSPADLPLCTPNPRPGRFYVAVEREDASIEAGQEAALKQFCQEKQITPFAVMFAAWAAALWYHTVKPRIVIWVTFSNREQAGRAGLVGWLSNSHIIGIDVGPHMTFRSLFAQATDKVRLGAQHSEIPIALLWHRLRRCAERGVPIAFRVGGDRSVSSDSTLLRQMTLPVDRRHDVGIELTANLRSCGLTLTLLYARELLDRSAARRLLTSAKDALVAAVNSPEKELASLTTR